MSWPCGKEAGDEFGRGPFSRASLSRAEPGENVAPCRRLHPCLAAPCGHRPRRWQGRVAAARAGRGDTIVARSGGEPARAGLQRALFHETRHRHAALRRDGGDRRERARHGDSALRPLHGGEPPHRRHHARLLRFPPSHDPRGSRAHRSRRVCRRFRGRGNERDCSGRRRHLHARDSV